MPFWKYPVHAIAYGFGTGLAPVAPGSFGTLVGVGLYRIMADDVIAGLYALLVLHLVRWAVKR